MGEGIPNRRERKESPEIHLVVEVGSGNLSMLLNVPAEYRDRFDSDPRMHFVGVDIDFAELRHGKELLEKTDTETGREHNDRVSFVQGTAEALPFAGGTVDELTMRNVLGDPDIPVETKHSMLYEAARVIKKGGTLRVAENYTPLMVTEDDMLDFIRDMEGHPFEEYTTEEIAALPEHERFADTKLSQDDGHAFMAGLNFTLRYRRT